MGKLKAKRKFASENFTFIGGRSSKAKAKKLASQGRAEGFKARVVKATKTAKKQGSPNYQVWGSVKKRSSKRKGKPKKPRAKGKVLTWREFNKMNMSKFMKSEGGHGPAMTRMGREWASYKKKHGL